MRFAGPFGLDIDTANLDHTVFGAGTIKIIDGGGIASHKSQGKQANKGAERAPQRETQENPAARGVGLMQQGHR